MTHHKKLHRLVPKQVDNLDGSKSIYMAQGVLSETHRQNMLRAKLFGQHSKSFNDLDAQNVIEGISKDIKMVASSTSDLVEKQESLHKPVKKEKKTLCGYFKKLIKHGNAKSKDSNNNHPQSEDQGSGKPGLNKFKNVSKSVNCLFEGPLYDVSSGQDSKDKLKRKIPKGRNKKEFTAKNKMVSYWLDTGRVLSDGPRDTRFETKVTKKSKGNVISRMVKGDYNESIVSVKTEVLFKQKYGVSSYEIDSDFDGEVTDTTSLSDSEDNQHTSRVTPELQQSSEHESIQSDDCCHSSAPAAESDKFDQLIRKQSISLADYLQSLPTGDHEEEVTCSRPASLETEERINNLRQQLLVLARRMDRDDNKNSDSIKLPSSTESGEDVSTNSIWSKILVRSRAFRYPEQSEESKRRFTSGSFPHATSKEIAGGCKPIETVTTYLGIF